MIHANLYLPSHVVINVWIIINARRVELEVRGMAGDFFLWGVISKGESGEGTIIPSGPPPPKKKKAADGTRNASSLA